MSRAELAVVFAIAAAGFGAGMNVAPRVYGLASAPVLVLAAALVSAAGLALAATAGGFIQLAVGYGLLFGLGGGAGYLLVQQAVNLVATGHHGLINGYIVSLLPGGAMIATPICGWSVRELGVRATLGGLAAVVAASGAVAAWLVARSGAILSAAPRAAPTGAAAGQRPVFWRLWIIFFLAASAGLMVLSQAAGIIVAYGGATALAVLGTTLITGGITAARLAGGWMADWLAIPAVAAGAHTLALAGNVGLTLWPGPLMSVVGLGLVGLGYGVISGVTAAAVALYWEPDLYGRVASRLYLAWCAAAVVLPIAAGRLFDLTQGYGTAVLIAAAANVAGALVALGLPAQRSRG